MAKKSGINLGDKPEDNPDEKPGQSAAEEQARKEQEAQAAAEKIPEDAKPTKLRATQHSLYNPYQKIRFRTDEAVTVPYVDNWDKCQIDAGLLEVAEEPAE